MDEFGKATLWRIIKVMFLILLLAFIYVLLSGTRVSGIAEQQSRFDNIDIGETVLQRLKGQRVWVTRISEQQRSGYATVSSDVVAEGGCAISTDICVLAASTDITGVNLSFSKDEPPQLPSDATWVSGFVNPTSGAVFDLWGRAYRFSGVASLRVVVSE